MTFVFLSYLIFLNLAISRSGKVEDVIIIATILVCISAYTSLSEILGLIMTD